MKRAVSLPLVSMAAAGLVAMVAGGVANQAAEPQAGGGGAKIEALTSKALGYLRLQRAEDGTYSRQRGPGVTAVVVAGILSTGRVSPDDPLVAPSLKYLEGILFKSDGSVNTEALGGHGNYIASIIVMAMAEANRDGRYKVAIQQAERYLRRSQWDEDEQVEGMPVGPDHPFYGGAGYGGSRRPDLSNTQFLLDALKAAGAESDDPAIQKALVFVSRSQNLSSEFNSLPWAGKVNDGGFIYTAASGGASMAGKTADGGLRSYGSMSYAGLKSMIYAGLGPKDRRVAAAVAWARRHYTLDENPGMGQQGLYYYYHTMAKALDAFGEERFVDAKGRKHDWRREMVEALARRQRADGSWVNEADRWYEGDANLVTGYALLALRHCRAKAGL